jgi:hypothetical protein
MEEVLHENLTWIKTLEEYCGNKYGNNKFKAHLMPGQVTVTVWQIPDAVDTVVYAPDYG